MTRVNAKAGRERRRFPFPDGRVPDFLPSVVIERLERETGRRVVQLTVHYGQVGEYEVVLEGGDKEAE